MFATHPPLPKRINRVLPDWDGHFPNTDSDQTLVAAAAGFAPTPMAAAASGFAGQGTPAGQAPDRITEAAPTASGIEQIGQPTDAHIQYAHTLIQQIPEQVVAAAHEPFAARAVIYCLVIDPDAQIREAQMQQLAQFDEAGIADLVNRLLPKVQNLPPQTRLPLIEMAIPAMKRLSPRQYELFKNNLQALVRADEKIDLFEWTLQRILLHNLDAEYGKSPSHGTRQGLSELTRHVQVLLSVLSYVGHRHSKEAQAAFDAARGALKPLRLSQLPMDQCGLEAMGQALDALAAAQPKLKRNLIKACASCISADQQVTTHEAELLRAICDSLDCPMPPLLPGQPLT